MSYGYPDKGPYGGIYRGIYARAAVVSPPSVAVTQTATVASGDQGVVLPFGSAVVAGAGTAAANGTYTYSGQYGGRPYFNKSGTDPLVSSIVYDTDRQGGWAIYDSGVVGALYVDDAQTTALIPWDVSISWVENGGSAPAPTVAASRVAAGESVVVAVSFDDTTENGFAVEPTFIGGGDAALTGDVDTGHSPERSAIYSGSATGATGIQVVGADPTSMNVLVAVLNRTVTVRSTDSNTATGTSLALPLTGSGLAIAAYAIAEGSDKFGAVPAGCEDLAAPFGQPALGMRVVSGTPGTITQDWSPSAAGSAVGVVLS